MPRDTTRSGDDAVTITRQRAVKALREWRRTRSRHWWREYHHLSQWLKNQE